MTFVSTHFVLFLMSSPALIFPLPPSFEILMCVFVIMASIIAMYCNRNRNFNKTVKMRVYTDDEHVELCDALNACTAELKQKQVECEIDACDEAYKALVSTLALAHPSSADPSSASAEKPIELTPDEKAFLEKWRVHCSNNDNDLIKLFEKSCNIYKKHKHRFTEEQARVGYERDTRILAYLKQQHSS